MHDKFFYKPNSEPQWAEERQFDTVEAFHKYANTAGNKLIHFLTELFCLKICFDLWEIFRSGTKIEFHILGEIICKTRSKWQTITTTVLCENEYETVRNCSDVIESIEKSGKLLASFEKKSMRKC